MATMNKSDVKYEEKNIKSLSWDKVRALTGKTIPTIAMQTVKALSKSNPKAYVKVGLIKKDLYIRIKDGSKHLDDIKLVANWTDPAGTEGELKKESDPGVKLVIGQVKDSLAKMKAGEKVIKLKHKAASDLSGDAQEIAGLVGSQPVAEHRQRDLTRLRKFVTDVRRLQTEADAEFTNEVEAPFAFMRTKTNLNWPDNTDPKVKKAWASDFYQSQMKPVYARSKDISKELATFVDDVEDALDMAETADRDGDKASTVIDKRVAALVKKMNAEWSEASDKAFLADGRGDNFNQALDGIRDFMQNKYDFIKGGTTGLAGALEQLGNIGNKLKMLDKSEKAITRRGKAITECAVELVKLGKEHKTNGNATAAAVEAKQKIKDVASLQKRVAKEKKQGMDLLKKGKDLAKGQS